MFTKSRKLDIVVAFFFVALFSSLLTLQVVTSWTGNQNTLSVGFVEVNEINATDYYFRDVNVSERIQGNYNLTGLWSPWLSLNGVNRSTWPAGGGVPFDQSLNTTDDVSFNSVNATSTYYYRSVNRSDYLIQERYEGSTAFVGFNTSLDYMENYFLCDGVNDHVQIQQALDYVGSGKVTLSEGNFSVRRINITSTGAWLCGSGKNTVLRHANPADARTLLRPDGLDITISDMSLNGSCTNSEPFGDHDGINVRCGCTRGCTIERCYFFDWGHKANDHAIEVQFNSPAKGVLVSNCYFYNTSTICVAFASAGGRCILTGSHFYDCYAFETDNGIGNAFVGNVFEWSGAIIYSDQNIVTGNVFCNGDEALADQGLRIEGNNTVVSGNVFWSFWTYCLRLGGSDTVIVGNHIRKETGVDGAIRIYNGSYGSMIHDNRIETGAGPGIEFFATTTSATIKDNTFDVATLPVDVGAFTPTVMGHTLVLPFVEGKTYEAGTSNPWGWNLTLAGDWSSTQGYLPLDVQQVLRLQVWAASWAAPGAGNGMYVEFLFNAGQEDEQWNAEAIQVANSLSDTRNFAVHDVIKWTYTPTNDTDIGDLIGGDAFCSMVLFESNPDGHIDTNACFYCLVVEYV